MTAQKYVRVGQIVNTQGIKGELRVLASTDFPQERFKVGSELYIDTKTAKKPVTIEKSRQHKNFQILKFLDLDNINDVELFKGQHLYVATANRPENELDADEYYYQDIIGLTVVETQTNAVYGTVTDILALGPNDVWRIDSPQHGEILMPYLKTIVDRIDLTEKKAYVTLPEGLIDEN